MASTHHQREKHRNCCRTAKIAEVLHAILQETARKKCGVSLDIIRVSRSVPRGGRTFSVLRRSRKSLCFWLATCRPEINSSNNVFASLVFVRIDDLLLSADVHYLEIRLLTSRVLVCSIRMFLCGTMCTAFVSMFLISMKFGSKASIQGYESAKLCG